MAKLGSLDQLCVPKEEGGLAFKNVHNHNMSLVAKQAWRLLTCPQYLVARIFGVRYFPLGRVTEATLGHNPSYIWRSMHETLPLIRDGKQVRIWNKP